MLPSFEPKAVLASESQELRIREGFFFSIVVPKVASLDQ